MVTIMKTPPGYKQTDLGAIPEDWEVCELGAIGKFKNGINKNADSFGYGYPFVNLLDIFGRTKLTNSTPLGLINSSIIERRTYELKKGDVLFIRSSVKPEGVGLTSVVIEDLRDTVYSGFLIRFRDRGQLSIEYKAYCFYDQEFRKRVIENSTVSANTNINQVALKKIKIAFPTNKDEQITIAQALRDVDELIYRLDELIQKKHNIKQGVMQELLTGKRRLPGFSGEWITRAIGKVFGFYRTANNSRADLMGEGVVHYIHYGDLHTLYKHFIDFTQAKLPFVPQSKILNPALLKEGDLIIADASEDTENIGLAVEIRNLGTKKAIAGLHTFLLRDEQNTFANGYKGYLLSTYAVRQQLTQVATGVSVYGLSKDNLSNIEIYFPEDKREQDAIAKLINDMDLEIQQLQSILNKYKDIQQGMMQQLLTGKVRLI
jgi:type I restriction enzyme S subunit